MQKLETEYSPVLSDLKSAIVITQKLNGDGKIFETFGVFSFTITALLHWEVIALSETENFVQ